MCCALCCSKNGCAEQGRKHGQETRACQSIATWVESVNQLTWIESVNQLTWVASVNQLVTQQSQRRLQGWRPSSSVLPIVPSELIVPSLLVQLLDLLEAYLRWRHLPDGRQMHYLRIDGSTSLEDR
jgi:SNF2 family DNA or RNA helicase